MLHLRSSPSGREEGPPPMKLPPPLLREDFGPSGAARLLDEQDLLPAIVLTSSPGRNLWRKAAALSAGFLMVLSVASSTDWAQNAPAAENGVFSILSGPGQRQVGTERFKITPSSAGAEASGELQLDAPGGARVSESCTLKLDRNLRPVSYERRQRTPKKGAISAEFGSPETKLITKTDAGTSDQTFYLPANHLVVLDTNFFHHYALLLRQYDGVKAGVQQFNVFIPQEAEPGTISLELQGKENQTIGKTAREWNHFQAVTDQVKIEIWATPEGGIYRMSIPQANLEVLRQ